MRLMLHGGLTLLGVALAGILVFATGLAGFSPCGPTLGGYVALPLILIGLPVGTFFLVTVGSRAGWRRWRRSQTETRLQLNLH